MGHEWTDRCLDFVKHFASRESFGGIAGLGAEERILGRLSRQCETEIRRWDWAQVEANLIWLDRALFRDSREHSEVDSGVLIPAANLLER